MNYPRGFLFWWNMKIQSSKTRLSKFFYSTFKKEEFHSDPTEKKRRDQPSSRHTPFASLYMCAIWTSNSLLASASHSGPNLSAHGDLISNQKRAYLTITLQNDPSSTERALFAILWAAPLLNSLTSFQTTKYISSCHVYMLFVYPLVLADFPSSPSQPKHVNHKKRKETEHFITN